MGIRREDVRRGDEVVAGLDSRTERARPFRSGAGRLQHDSSVGRCEAGRLAARRALTSIGAVRLAAKPLPSTNRAISFGQMFDRAEPDPTHVAFATPVASSSSNEIGTSRVFDRLAIAVIAVVGVLSLLTFRDYGLSWDDYAHSEYGDLLLKLYASGFRDQRALSWINLYYYGGGFDLLAALAAKILPFTLFETRRLIGAAVGILGLAVTWRIGRRMGGPLAGLMALILLATCPLYYGHMFMNPKDSPFAVATAIFLLGAMRALEQYPRVSLAAGSLVGIGFGLSFGSRIMGAFGLIGALAAVALIFAVESRAFGMRSAGARLGHFLLALVPAMLLAYAVMALVWPWSVIDPLNPFRAVEYFSHFFEKPWQELFDGRLVSVPDMPRAYVPTLFALKLPVIFSVLGFGGAAGAMLAAFASGIASQPARRFSPDRTRQPVTPCHHDRVAARDVQRHPAFRVRLAAAGGARRPRRRVSHPDGVEIGATCAHCGCHRLHRRRRHSRWSKWCGCTLTNTPTSTGFPAVLRTHAIASCSTTGASP